MSSTISCRLMISRRARLWVPLALLSALPLVAAGDEPARTKPATKRPATSEPVMTLLTELTDQPLSKAKVTEKQGRNYLRSLITARGTPRALIVPTPQGPTRPRDLLYRGENAGPYHAIYLQGVPPGVRIKGVTPPPIAAPRIHLVVPKAAPMGKSKEGEKK